MKKLLIVVIGLMLLMVGCSQDGELTEFEQTIAAREPLCESLPDERLNEKAFKGIELYSYQNEDGDWAFSVLPGTNRAKFIEEGKSGSLDLDQLEECFCKLAVGEHVFWMDLSKTVQEESEKATFPFPPNALVQQVLDLANNCEIELWTHFE